MSFLNRLEFIFVLILRVIIAVLPMKARKEFYDKILRTEGNNDDEN